MYDAMREYLWYVGWIFMAVIMMNFIIEGQTQVKRVQEQYSGKAKWVMLTLIALLAVAVFTMLGVLIITKYLPLHDTF